MTLTDNKNSKQSFFREYSFVISLPLVVIFSFIGAYFVLPTAGILSTLMIVIPSAICVSLVKCKFFIKISIFSLVSLGLNTVYSPFSESVITAVIFAFLLILAELSIYLFKKKKVIPILSGVMVLLLLCAAHIFVMGNPIDAISSNSRLSEYVDNNYVLSEIDVTSTYFDRSKRIFCRDINFKEDPTNIFTLYASDNYITDGFKNYAEKYMMKSERLAITKALRKAFPKDSFTVSEVGISGYPKTVLSLDDKDKITSCMYFDIFIPSDISDEKFEEKCISYCNALYTSGFDNAYYRFIGGKAGFYYREITLRPIGVPQNTKAEYLRSSRIEEFIYERNILPYGKQ